MLFELKDKKEVNVVKKVNLATIEWKEKDLEDYVTKHMQYLISEDLMPIFNERNFQEEPDIIAVDKIGNLYIFELKRWESNKENLLQVFRYGQNEKFGRASYEQLNELYHKKYKVDETLIEAHADWFDLEDSQKLDEYSFNNNQKFIILTNGIDFNTLECIKFWKNNGLDIEAMIYNIYVIGDKYYIEFSTYSPYGVVPENGEHSIYILNTNKRYDESCTEDMINNKKASAYGSRKERINKMKKKDKVYLYEKGVGIVARGIVKTGEVKTGYWGEDEGEKYVELEDFVSFREKPIKPKFKINQQLCWSISEEDAKKIDEEINKK